MSNTKVDEVVTISDSFKIKYSAIKRIFCTLCFILILCVGVFFIILGTILTTIFGCMLIATAFIKIIDMLLFKSLSIGENYLVKEWYLLGEKKIAIKDLVAINTKKIWDNYIIFYDKNTFRLLAFYMNFETFAAKRGAYEQLKNVLLDKNIISLDDKSWQNIKKDSLLKKMIKRVRTK